MTTFGARFKAARRARTLTQEEVAEALGITKSAVSSYETDSATPSFDKLREIRRLLHASLDDLICGDATAARMAQQYKAIQEGKADYEPKFAEQVSDEERRFLELLRKMSRARRMALLQLLD